MILPAQVIRALCLVDRKRYLYSPDWQPLITPFHERTVHDGLSFGLSSAGYDIRLADSVRFLGEHFVLASSCERFVMPTNLLGQVCDKSTWARRGVTVQNTIIEPGWAGFLTLELIKHVPGTLFLPAGTPIAQIVFMRLTEPTEQPYKGKYHEQEAGPQPARFEEAK